MITSLKAIFQKTLIILTTFSIIAFSLFSNIDTAQAQTPRYAGQLVYSTGNQSLSLNPGQTFKVAVTFQNTGTLTWDNTSNRYISIYTFEPRYRDSIFYTNNWSRTEQPGRMEESRVAPGERGTIYFDFTAPAEPGIYKEVFHLASEDTAWISGGLFSYIIEVKDINEVAEVAAEEKIIAEAENQKVSADLVAMSSRGIRTRAGAPIMIQALVRNASNITWQEVSLEYANMSIASDRGIAYAHSTWNGSTITRSNQTVLPGENAHLTFFLQAPEINGHHTPKFKLKANELATDLYLELPIEVTGGQDAPISNPAPDHKSSDQKSNEKDNSDENSQHLIAEPNIRIGVLIVDEETDDEVVISAPKSGLILENLSGEVLLRVPQGAPIRAWYNDNLYFYEYNQVVSSSVEPIRFIPGIANAPLSVDNFDRRATRNAQFADNTFRNILEMRHNSHRDRVWLINELPIELYLRGLVETSDLSPMEYHKATITAARTFATYHMTRNYKWPREFFHITAYSWDQVYNGYERELRSPRIVQAVNETRGEVITYDDEIVLTPYFSRSDGRTRNWGDVLNGSAPWAVSVPVPCDVGRTLLGHGVGMSLSGAICMASEGMNSEEILRHFYTGIDIIQKW